MLTTVIRIPNNTFCYTPLYAKQIHFTQFEISLTLYKKKNLKRQLPLKMFLIIHSSESCRFSTLLFCVEFADMLSSSSQRQKKWTHSKRIYRIYLLRESFLLLLKCQRLHIEFENFPNAFNRSSGQNISNVEFIRWCSYTLRSLRYCSCG